MYVLSPFAGTDEQFFDNSGNPLSGGKIYTYSAGTTTPVTVYQDNAGNVAHANPIVLDSAGRVPGGQIWLPYQQKIKFILKTSADATLVSVDNVATPLAGEMWVNGGVVSRLSGSSNGRYSFGGTGSNPYFENSGNSITVNNAHVNTANGYGYKVDGTSVIDSSRNGVFNTLTEGGTLLSDKYALRPSMARVYNTTNTATTSGIDSTLTFDSESYDVGGLHNVASFPERITFATAGYYRVMAKVGFDNVSATGNRTVYFQKNGSGVLVIAGVKGMTEAVATVLLETTQYFNANDYVTVKVSQNSGGNLNVLGGSDQTYAEVIRVAT